MLHSLNQVVNTEHFSFRGEELNVKDSFLEALISAPGNERAGTRKALVFVEKSFQVFVMLLSLPYL